MPDLHITNSSTWTMMAIHEVALRVLLVGDLIDAEAEGFRGVAESLLEGLDDRAHALIDTACVFSVDGYSLGMPRPFDACPSCVRCSSRAPVFLDEHDPLSVLPLFARGWTIRASGAGGAWVCDGCDGLVPRPARARAVASLVLAQAA